MRVYGIFGIKESAINELIENHIKTFTIINAYNLETLKNLKEGDFIFITSTLKQDLRNGSEGVLCKVLEVSIIPQIITGFEEKEVVAGRLKVEMLGFAKCSITNSEFIEIRFRTF
ncbi:DUF473 family protein [Methanocaldococcus sp.]